MITMPIWCGTRNTQRILFVASISSRVTNHLCNQAWWFHSLCSPKSICHNVARIEHVDSGVATKWHIHEMLHGYRRISKNEESKWVELSPDNWIGCEKMCADLPRWLHNPTNFGFFVWIRWCSITAAVCRNKRPANVWTIANQKGMVFLIVSTSHVAAMPYDFCPIWTASLHLPLK